MKIVPHARTPLARIGSATATAMNIARRIQLRKQTCATRVPSAIIAIRNFTPEHASATSNSPAGVSMNTPSITAGTPLQCVSTIVSLAVIVCNAGTSSSPTGTRNSM